MSDFDRIFRLVGCNRLAKKLLNEGYTFEESLLGYRWNYWVEGFQDGVEHFEKLVEEGL